MKYSFFLVLCVVGTANADVLFSDSFESGDGSAWDFELGTTAYENTGCQDGTWCMKKTINGGSCQVSVFNSKSITLPQDLWIKWYVKYPIGFSFDNQPACNTSSDFKMLIVESPPGGEGRCFLNNRNGSGNSAQLIMICEGTGENNEYGSGQTITADGQWHEIVVHISRVPGSQAGRLESWYDGNKWLDTPHTVCNTTCATDSQEIKVGAYVNYGAINTQSFFIDNVTIADTSLAPSNNNQNKQRVDGIALDGISVK